MTDSLTKYVIAKVGMVLEALYANKTVKLSRAPTPSLLYPKASAGNNYIRSLHLDMKPMNKDWIFLEKLSKGEIGFKNLHTLELRFGTCGVYTERDCIWRMNNVLENTVQKTPKDTPEYTPLIFNVEKLKVEYDRCQSWWGKDVAGAFHPQASEKLILDNINIGKKGTKTAVEKWKWMFEIHDNEMGFEVEYFTETSVDNIPDIGLLINAEVTTRVQEY
jgi:hypothetical protein